MKARWLLVVAGVVGVLGGAAGAADWPQWRGPQRDGTSRETGLLEEWPREGPRLLWQRKDVGEGYATPAVVGDRIYLLGNKGMADEFVQALSVRDGRQVWATRLGRVGPNMAMQFPGARSTPTVDGELLFALSSDGELACLETAGGKVRWRKNVRTEFGGKCGWWAYSESPLVDGDVLVCSPGGSDATLVALHKKTGDVLWKAALPEGDIAGYASAIVVEAAGVKQYVQFLQKGVVGVDARTGKLLWRYAQTAQRSRANIVTPVAHDGCVYTASGEAGGGLVKLKAHQGAVEAEQLYCLKNLPASIGGSVRVGEYLYGTNGRGLLCAEFATGNLKWQDKCIGRGAVCYADGRLYVHGENGQVALVEATPAAYREKGRFTPPDQPQYTRRDEKAWAYPVVANGRLYIRDQGSLWCYDVQAAR
jgi:outer membrane protein assembly factor BamB